MLKKIKNFIKKNLANLLMVLFTIGTIYTVNSACTCLYGQPVEPESLKRFKK